MTTDLIQHFIDMPTEELQPILYQVLDTEASPAGPWSVTEIGRSVGMATAGIYRIAGSASTSAGVQPWSVVVKVLGPPRIPNREFDAAAAHRELAVYRSGVFASQQSRVRSPHCFAIEAWNDLHFIWLEDLSAAPQPPWPPEYFIQTAHHIGQFNGNWSEATLPDWTWLSPDDLRTKYQSPKHAKVFARLSALQKTLWSAAPSPLMWPRTSSSFGKIATSFSARLKKRLRVFAIGTTIPRTSSPYLTPAQVVLPLPSIGPRWGSNTWELTLGCF